MMNKIIPMIWRNTGKWFYLHGNLRILVGLIASWASWAFLTFLKYLRGPSDVKFSPYLQILSKYLLKFSQVKRTNVKWLHRCMYMSYLSATKDCISLIASSAIWWEQKQTKNETNKSENEVVTDSNMNQYQNKNECS